MKTIIKKAFSLQELLIVIAIIAVMMIVLVMTGTHLDKQAKFRDARNTMMVLSTAIERYNSKFGSYPLSGQRPAAYLPNELVDDDTDDQGFDRDSLALADIGWHLLDPATTSYDYPNGVDEQRDYQASIEALYIVLSWDEEVFEILEAIPDKFLTSKTPGNEDIEERLILTPPGGQGRRLIRILDPWGTPYRYIYRAGSPTAVIESAGPDKRFARTAPGVDPQEDEFNLDNISY